MELSELRQNVIIESIILLNRHTSTVELATRLLSKGILDPRTLMKNLRKFYKLISLPEEIEIPKMIGNLCTENDLLTAVERFLFTSSTKVNDDGCICR